MELKDVISAFSAKTNRKQVNSLRKTQWTSLQIISISANSMDLSPGFSFCGFKYETSQTTLQDVITCNICAVNNCLQNHKCKISITPINNVHGRRSN